MRVTTMRKLLSHLVYCSSVRDPLNLPAGRPLTTSPTYEAVAVKDGARGSMKEVGYTATPRVVGSVVNLWQNQMLG